MARYNSVSATGSIVQGGTISSPYTGLLTTITTGAGTTNLPNPVLYAGSVQTFYNATAAAITLSTPSGNITGPGTGGTQTISLPAGSVITLASDGTNYIAQDWLGGPLAPTSITASGTITANSTVTFNPSNANISIQPSGTGTVTINPAVAGALDNIVIGANTAKAGTFSTLTVNAGNISVAAGYQFVPTSTSINIPITVVAGWYRFANTSVSAVGDNGTRGAFKATIMATGGYQSPGQAVVYGFKDWSSTARITRVEKVGTQYFTDWRLMSTTTVCWLEGYTSGFTLGGTNTMQIMVEPNGLSAGSSWSVTADATLTAGLSTSTIGIPSPFFAVSENGNVVVGTALATTTIKMHVKAAQASDWMAAFDNTGTNPYGLRVDTSGNSGTAYSLGIYTNVGTGLFVLNDGRVGIGTTSPSVGLDLSARTDAILLPKGTSAQRPASPVAGMTRFNTDSNITTLEVYNGTGWLLLKAQFVAVSTGTVTTSGAYTIHTFTSSGSFTVSAGSGNIETLVVAGGGGTGFDVGGGGGGGGIVYTAAFAVSVGTYSVTVGTGGSSGQVASTAGGNGTNSQFGSQTAAVGGGGGGTYPSGQVNGLGGGSGGGAGNQNASGGSGTAGQGYGGGTSAAAWGSGGGGGAGGAGANGITGAVVAGGSPAYYSITGTSVAYSGGGYGNSDGGAVYATGNNASNTTVGYYGFGANGTGAPNNSPYNGNPGIVIVRYLT